MVYSNLSKIKKACIEHTFSQITLKKKSGIKYSSWVLKTDHSLTVSYIR